MRKLKSDIRKAVKSYFKYKRLYEEAMENLASLKVLEEVQRLDDADKLKLNLREVVQYGAYISGIQKALLFIRDRCILDSKSISKDRLMHLKANIELALSSKIAAERLVVGEWGNIKYRPVKDKKGNVTGYKANFYVITKNIVEL